MSMDNFRISILVDSCRKFIPKKQRITIFETFEVIPRRLGTRKEKNFQATWLRQGDKSSRETDEQG